MSLMNSGQKLEVEPRAKLHDAGIESSANTTEGGAVDIEDGAAFADVEVSSIEHIEHFSADLQSRPRFTELEVSKETGVPVDVQRPVDEVDGQIARRTRSILEEDLPFKRRRTDRTRAANGQTGASETGR